MITNGVLFKVSSIDDIQNLQPEVVGLKGMDLSDAEVLIMAKLSSLIELDLSGCELLTDQAVTELRRLLRLQALDLSFCNLITDRSVMAIAKLPALRRLSLNWCYSITDVALRQLGQSLSLEMVTLWSCEEVTDVGIEALSRLPQLRHLELPEFGRITDTGLYALATNASQLEILRLDHLAMISDEGIDALRALPHLTKITVQNCRAVTESGIDVLRTALPGCQIISDNGYF